MSFLRIITFLMFFASLAASLLALLGPPHRITVFLVWIAYMLNNYFYQFSFTFYNPLLQQIAPPHKEGFISGLGHTANWLGQIAGIVISLPLIGGAILFFGKAGRTQALLPTTIIFFLLSIPMLLWFKEKAIPQKISINILNEYKNYWQSFKNLCKQPGIGRYLLGFFFFNDAILTAQNNFPIFLQQVFGVSDKVKSFLLLGILLTSAIGAFVSGYISDKIGLKKTLLFILVGWMFFCPAMSLVNNFTHMIVLSVIMGLFYGSTWTVARAIMTYLAPPDKLNYSFSFYTLAERFATFAGPLSWGLITSVVFHTGALRYRIAALTLIIFIILGFIIVKKIPSDKNNISKTIYGTTS